MRESLNIFISNRATNVSAGTSLGLGLVQSVSPGSGLPSRQGIIEYSESLTRGRVRRAYSTKMFGCVLAIDLIFKYVPWRLSNRLGEQHV